MHDSLELSINKYAIFQIFSSMFSFLLQSTASRQQRNFLRSLTLLNLNLNLLTKQIPTGYKYFLFVFHNITSHYSYWNLPNWIHLPSFLTTHLSKCLGESCFKSQKISKFFVFKFCIPLPLEWFKTLVWVN